MNLPVISEIIVPNIMVVNIPIVPNHLYDNIKRRLKPVLKNEYLGLHRFESFSLLHPNSYLFVKLAIVLLRVSITTH